MNEATCKFIKKTPYIILLMTFSVILFAMSTSAYTECWQYDQNESGCTSGNASVVCDWTGYPMNLCNFKGCWDFGANNATCQTANEAGLPCTWINESDNAWCSETSCWDWDHTDQATCESNVAGLDCVWDNSNGYCDMQAHGGCADFDGQESECLNTFFCEWNAAAQECNDPTYDNIEEEYGAFTPGCFMFGTAAACNNLTGKCTWLNGECEGPDFGVACTDVEDKGICDTIPVFSTCCSWAGGKCNTTFSTSCWDNMQEPPEGAMFCEDWLAIGNETICNQIAGSPWFMPCKWHNMSTVTTDDDRCGFNGDDFFKGGGDDFFDINSKANCEAASGVWKSEQYTTPDGKVKNDQWCEMNHGIGAESCDSSCWACEFQQDGSGWANEAAAQAACEASALGFCKWRSKSEFEMAPNGMGFCDKPMELQTAGCGVQTGCQDYEYYADPETSCNNDEDCKWMVDEGDATIQWCAGANAKPCSISCGQCRSDISCLNNGTNCDWDDNSKLCKPQTIGGNEAEICFDGVDNDNDGSMDCADSECLSDPFCGGAGGFDCFQYNDNDTCITNSNGECTWINDTWHAWCDIKGTDCWLYDDDETDCGEADGCSWVTSFYGSDGGICDINESLYEGCWQAGNESDCNLNGNCTWKNFTYFEGAGAFSMPGATGFCEAKPFTCWDSYYGDEAGCILDENCAWINDTFHQGGGYCDGVCHTYNSTDCNADSNCELLVGICQPDNFVMGGCWQYDGNETACTDREKCAWHADPFFDNDTMNMPDKGWCNDAFMMQQFQGMEEGAPELIADDSDGCGTGSADEDLSDHIDICGVGVKEMPNSYGFGVKVDSLATAAICNNKPLDIGGLGSGEKTGSYRLYLDTNGDDTGGCNASSSNMGYEFFFKYETSYTNSQIVEVKTSFKCVSGDWVPAPVPIDSWPEKSCSELGAVIMAIDKATLESYTEFNKSAALRSYATASNITGNDSSVLDSAGPGFYHTGSVDFVPEDCTGLTDMDGDGCLPAEDPDCMVFNQFGFIPFEDCWNNLDDNFDGLVDCDDPMCKYDMFACGGSLEADANDKEPPQVAWSKLHSMPDGAMFDVDTFEPSNATLMFYGNATSCTTINATIEDDVFMPWHSLPIDNFAFNPQAIGYDLIGNETYRYKYKLCDISGNCKVSKCINFTTPADYTDCGRECNAYLDPMDFVPPTGSAPTDPLGNLGIFYDLDGDGSYDLNKTYGDSSTKKQLNDTRKVNIKLGNPNATTEWGILCVNGTIPSSVSFNASKLVVNDSAGNGLVGMPTSEYSSKFIADFGCKRIQITVPYNGTNLFHCVNQSIDGTGSCTNVTAQALQVETGENHSTWEVDPSVIGFSYYQATEGVIAAAVVDDGGDDGGDSSGGSGGSGGGGGGSATGTFAASTTKTQVFASLGSGQKATMNIGKDEISVAKITFKADNALSSAKVTVKKVDEDKVPSKLDNVYQYIEITKDAFTNDDISDVTFTFEIPETWFTENGYDPDTVSMKRYTDKWEELTVVKIATSLGIVKYEATSPGFSYFAVTAEKAAVVETVEEEEEVVEAAAEAEEVLEELLEEEEKIIEPEPEPTEFEEKSRGFLKTAIILLVVLIVVVGVYMKFLKKQKKQEH